MHQLLLSVLTAALAAPPAPAVKDAAPPWVEAMRRVHAKFTGTPGTFAHLGDSITITLAFWTPLLYERKNASPAVDEAYDLVKKYQREECWRTWKGPEYGNQGSMTVRWAAKNIDRWLEKLDPETALFMFGTNDLHSLDLEEYRETTRSIVEKCLANGTVVILTTIPPRHGFEEKAKRFAEAIRQIARELHVPCIDYQAEILARRPDDWDGALEKFADYRGYQVPTLLSRDGVHPSNPKQWAGDFSAEGLRTNGYTLRNYLTLLMYARVIREVYGTGGDKGAPGGH